MSGPPTPPSVSVIVPAYNAGRVIGNQLAALSRQDFDQSWELLVCDNGSTDDTVAVARSWADRLPIRVVDASARRGPAAARNIGVAVARAPLLAFCDADDVVADDWLARVVVALGTDAYVCVAALYRAPYTTPSHPEYFPVTHGTRRHMPELISAGAGHSAVRAAAFREVGGFDESLRTAEDVDLSWRLQLAGHPLVPHPEATVTITSRTGVASTFLQRYRWAIGDRQLMHKYQLVEDVLRQAHGPSVEGPAAFGVPLVGSRPTGAQASAAGRRGRLVRALTSPAEFAQLVERTYLRVVVPIAERAGSALGHRFGRIDTSMPQIDPSVAHAYLARQHVDRS